MTAIREALGLKCPVCIDDDRIDAALVELDALEAVAEAAQTLAYSTWRETTPQHVALRAAFHEALARLAAVRDGQTFTTTVNNGPSVNISLGDAWRASERAEAAAARQERGLLCPCRVHGDPDGDCGERCA